MKKTMMTIVAAMALAVVHGLTPAETNALRSARAFAAAESFPTNNLGIPICGFMSQGLLTNATLAAAVDDILSVGKITPVNINGQYPDVLPKTWARIKRERADLLPMHIALFDGGYAPNDLESTTRMSLEGFHRGYGFISLFHIETARSYVLRVVGPYIRRHLRKQGKSFITVDGVNPQQALMDEISACLNAPKFSGLQAKLAEIGLDIPVGSFDDVTPSAASLEIIKDKIYYGDVEFSNHLKGMLLFCLGTEEYNKFVKRYNAE